MSEQAADRATQLRVFVEGLSRGDVKPVSVDYMRSLASDFDALSVRLAQAEARERAERDLREIADRERDKAQDRWAKALGERRSP